MPTQRRRKFEIKQRQKRRAKRRPVISGITGRGDSFNDLQRIVKQGFIGSSYPSVNAYASMRLSGGRSPYSSPSRLPGTEGDRYTIGMMTRVKRDFITARGPLMPGEEVHVGLAHPGQVRVINIEINPLISDAEEARRKEFYKRKFPLQRIEFK